MRCPFPGMDPYIERPEIWADFHDRFVTFLCGVLQPAIRPRYVALTQDRLYVVQAERPIRPDVSVVRTSWEQGSGAAAAVLEAEAPMIFELDVEEIREPYIEIIEPAAGNRLVTAIEVLSPENKAGGPGRRAYLRKRAEFENSVANLVEIDLLRRGRTTSGLSQAKLNVLKPYRYLVTVSRRDPPQQEAYAFPLERRLPRIAIPLADDDPDVTLDLQTAFARCWEEGPYPELLHYSAPPPADLSEEESAWCRAMLLQAGLTPG